jgi:hypothetical protein
MSIIVFNNTEVIGLLGQSCFHKVGIREKSSLRRIMGRGKRYIE